MRLDGKTVLVTAAGQRIGRATAVAMARDGAQVWAIDSRPALLAPLEEVPGVRAIALDALDRGATTRLIESMPALDALINCALSPHGGCASVLTDEHWNAALNANVRAPFWVIQAALPRMLSAGQGAIVNLLASIAVANDRPNRFADMTTRAAMVGVTLGVATDCVADGVRCNAICGEVADADASIAALTALAIYLASDESAAVTGQTCSPDHRVAS